MKTIILIFFTGLLGMTLYAQDYTGNQPHTIQDKLNEEYCSGMFHSTEGTIIDVSSESSARAYFNILDWLQGRIPGYQVYKYRYGMSIPVIRGGVPAVFVDEMQVSPSSLNNI